METGKTYAVNISSSEHPEWVMATWLRPGPVMRFHVMSRNGEEITVHDSDISEVEPKLARLRQEIQYHRDKAGSLRRRAAQQDSIADGKVKEAAALGTGLLPLYEATQPDSKS